MQQNDAKTKENTDFFCEISALYVLLFAHLPKVRTSYFSQEGSQKYKLSGILVDFITIFL